MGQDKCRIDAVCKNVSESTFKNGPYVSIIVEKLTVSIKDEYIENVRKMPEQKTELTKCALSLFIDHL